MSVTINVNGLSLVHKGSGGISTATLPNACFTPPSGAPVPYASVAFSRDLANGTRSVRADGGFSAATSRSVFATSTGDEAGGQGGVVSGVHGAEASFLTFSPNVRLEGSPACRLTDKMLHNEGNTINAGGELQDKVKKARGKRSKAAREVATLLVEVVDAATKKPVHSPVRVLLRAKGARRTSSSRDKAHHVVFHNVEKKKYRVVAIHGCYPEGYADVTVKKNKQKVRIELSREKLRDAAHRRGIRLSVNATNGPGHASAAKQEFDDRIVGTFWASLQGNSAADPIPDWATAGAVEAKSQGLGIELTPFFWAAAAMAGPGATWHPNPHWVNSFKTRAEAVNAVKAYISGVVAKFAAAGVIDHIKRVIVINEPMNAIARSSTRTIPYVKMIMPTARDKKYSAGEVLAIKRKNAQLKRENAKKPKGKRKKLEAVPAFYKLKSEAIISLVDIFEHTHALLPGVALIVNDYGIEGYNGKKGIMGMRGYRYYDLLRRMIKLLKARKNTSAIQQLRAGFQAHLRSGGQLKSVSTSEPLDFRPSSIRSQVKRLKKLGVKVCVTECDLELPALKRKGKTKYKNLAEEHIDVATQLVPAPGGKKRVMKPNYNASAYFANGRRRKLYLKAFTRQRDLTRDSVAAILRAGNVESFAWWDVEDTLPSSALGSNFRYHGYLLHRYLVCAHCKNDPAMQVVTDGGILYRKPKYWGSVAAFRSSSKAGLS